MLKLKDNLISFLLVVMLCCIHTLYFVSHNNAKIEAVYQQLLSCSYVVLYKIFTLSAINRKTIIIE